MKKITVPILTVILVAALLCGCAKLIIPPAPPEPEVPRLMPGIRKNSASVTVAQFRDDILQAVADFGRASMASAGPTPRAVADFEIPAPPVRVDNSQFWQPAGFLTDQIPAEIRFGCSPVTLEADRLPVLRMSGGGKKPSLHRAEIFRVVLLEAAVSEGQLRCVGSK